MSDLPRDCLCGMGEACERCDEGYAALAKERKEKGEFIDLSLIPFKWQAVHIHTAEGTQGQGDWQVMIRCPEGHDQQQWLAEFGFTPEDAFTKALATYEPEEIEEEDEEDAFS